MKKRIFGILLMGAMVVASMSMFTSCKDYDDDIQANKDDITALKTQLATLQTALTKAQSDATAAQSAADAAAAAAKNAQTAADNAGTAAKNAQASADDAAKAASANATAIKAAQDAIKALEDQVAAFAKVDELNAVKADLEKAIADATAGKVSAEELTEALKPISAKIDAIDESLNTLDGDVKALKEWKSTVEGQIATVQEDLKNQTEAIKALQEEIKNKITKGDLSGLANEDAIKAYVDNQLKAYATSSEVSAAVANALKTYTTTADLQKMLAGYSTPAAVATAIENALKNYYTVAKTDELVKNLKAEIEKAYKLADAAMTKEEVEKIAQDAADEVSKELNENMLTLNLFVNRALNSISLVPQLFVGGIEAIEFNSLQYKEVVKGTSGKTSVATAPYTLIDNGTAEAYYRLNPAIVERSSIDESKIEYLAATAATRAATVASPVTFNGIAEWNYGGQKGLVKVNLKKNITTSLNNPSSGDIYVVALKVPRKADDKKGIEAADIVSENSRLVENVITPKIARLPWNVTEELVKDDLNNKSNIHHYSDSAVVWQSKVDSDPLQMVYTEVLYNDTYDLLSHVTGCKQTTDVNVAAHTNQATDEITKAKLKTYGLTFRFAVAGTVAGVAYGAPTPNDVDHSTNQQKFAKVDPVTGVVSSVLPNGVTDNRACVGKEPIIRIMLVDTVRNKLVDERYMKIKWVEKKVEPKTLDTYVTKTTLRPCDINLSQGITWEWFITEVYAKAEINGLSQQTFENVYGTRTPSLISVTPNYNSVAGVDVLSPVASVALPSVQATTNERGDALIADWVLMPNEIARIYPSQSKTFKAQILFKSSLPTEYPDLILPWEWTITLPTLPEINGYYDNYWYTKYTLHDVMPVQYNSALYDEIAAGTTVPQGGELETYAIANGKYTYTDYKGNNGGYCVYYNNLMNAFTYEQAGTPLTPKFIVKNLGNDCGSWDMQFTKAGNDRVAGAAIPSWDTQHSDVTLPYTQYPNYAPKFGTNATTWASYLSADFEKKAWNTGDEFRGYRLYRAPWTANEKQALQMVWDDGHTSWCGNISHKQAILYADHNNAANQALINPLSQLNESDGRTPQRTHDKKVHIGIWGTLNDWNVIPVKNYDICLVAPIRINANVKGAFEEGYVSGTCVSCDDAFTLTDFRGYTVKNVAPTTAEQNVEWTKFQQQLYKYYEVGDPDWQLADVRYGMSLVGSDVKADDTKTYANALTSAQIKKYTNDNIVLSVEKKTWSGVDYLVFKNNGGSNVEEEVNVFIPVTVTYGFGSLTEYAKIRLYPKGQVASGVTIVAYPGNN